MRYSDDELFYDQLIGERKESEKYIQALDLLKSRVLIDKDPMTRKHALFLLSIIGDLQFADLFINSLHDPEKAVRNQAVQALVGIGSPVIPKVVILLNDSDWKVRYRAAEVLGRLKSREVVNPLIRSLSDVKDHVRYMAAKSLCLIREPIAIEPIRKCLNDENEYVRRMAERAISTLEKNNS
jgi:HEAT repeat protein